MGKFSIFDDELGYADTPTREEARETDCFIELSRGHGEDVVAVLESLEDFGTLGDKIAAVIRSRPGSPQQIKDGVYLAAGELQEYLARKLAEIK